ncbi:MAG: Aspartyl/glutamyl-tRNA(Asn/Gln) amidotransferase subunit B [Planctomycetes bacterium ADurb.Bin126]|nr:MAG: Aspartyl/glutamyl-tRNA(Asn/Gln) amidotransferase subunit B [Planctomycetes bacterium ADurb.Bin126]HOD79866.1 Asp-tRNA(Asn)/Glu-tRNA(Gln) amidotransferase subunit GatB [Phycisphaerae bacterium]HQL72875.1 Asp-tRNA(Asn)/Glu-tRNA(Gln) amidotransferase subunit GatB [Phycisphaerae bacterium]
MVESHDIVKPIIGLEIHVELATATKMFCRCRNHFGDPPNTNVCPVCIGMPGVLPVMNRVAVELSMKVGLALNCTVPDFTKWDRKSYYYPDLPKNYQISQYDLPLNVDGHIEVPLADGSIKKVRILRAHLEEDAGKNVHDNPAHTGVDLNRAGVPLLEIVSQPDMNSPEEAGAYGRAMQRLVRWLGASEANMQMGHMRFEPNINLHITRGGVTYKTPIVEVKNLNSFRSLEGAVAYEINRQYSEWLGNPDYTLDKCGKQNRGWDDVRLQTVFQREKEEAHDYRYFPEPDLVPVLVDAEWRERLRGQIVELPLARRARYMGEYGLTFKEADALTQDAPTGDLLDAAVAAGADAKRCTNLLLGRGAAIANERGCSIAEVGLSAGQLTDLAKMTDAGEINATAAAKLFDKLAAEGGSPRELAQAEGLLAVRDESALAAWVEEAVSANAQAADDARSEDPKKRKKAFGFLMGQVMQRSKGAAAPAAVQKLLQEKLGL